MIELAPSKCFHGFVLACALLITSCTSDEAEDTTQQTSATDDEQDEQTDQADTTDEPGDGGDSSTDTTSDDDTLPSGIVMKSIAGATFIMGNNDLLGPNAADATEHEVTLSDYEMSEGEITNAHYVEFLNAAYVDGLVEVGEGSAGPDAGKPLIVGSATSPYAGQVLYGLSGSRVMKDHDDGDGDGNSFTGVIEPENPLNIAYVGFDTSTGTFFVKDPHNAEHFHWVELCDYHDYTTTQFEEDTSSPHNDFDAWPELEGWTESNPAGALELHTLEEVSAYPVSFVRWWGAQAFAIYYGVSLPTEAQWEYAASGGQDFEYSVFDGSSVSDANYNAAGEHPALHHPRAAVSGSANPFGLYNLGGNVWEWIADHYAPFTDAAASDPLVEVEGSTTRSWRGGSWNYHQATLETAYRASDEESRGNDHFGFRIAR